ncbi:hypothetical protein JX266_003574 [Neoarthrinium moseri]|nr:hypothetical protein JX266_003574 [Neoarthrinium moseri]
MASEEPVYDPSRTGSWLVCSTCGTQFPTSDAQAVKTCFICDDPRQFTPPTGQSFTTLDAVRSGHRNVFYPLPSGSATSSAGQDPDFVSIVTEPKFAIGQRAVLVKTPHGNVLWDCVTLLDEETIERITGLGGLKAIVISHPHYYSAHVEWARAFQCPVYLADEDREWTTQSSSYQSFITEAELDLPVAGESAGVRVLKLGGHFPGSLVLLYKGRLLVADTLITTPAGLGSWEANALGEARERPKGLNSYGFMWSIPNMIPLPPAEMERMWAILNKYSFVSSHGAFVKTDIFGKDGSEVKRRVLESMQIQIRNMGYGDHAMLKESLD